MSPARTLVAARLAPQHSPFADPQTPLRCGHRRVRRLTLPGQTAAATATTASSLIVIGVVPMAGGDMLLPA